MTPGRLRAEIDLNELEKLCGLHCTQPDLAAWFGVHLHTIENRIASDELYDYDGEQMTFRQIMDRGYAKGRVSLRRRQMEAADRGNPAMLIWLGKQLLGQREQIDTMLTGSGPNGEIEINGSNSPREQLANRIARIAERLAAGGDLKQLNGTGVQ